MTAADVIARYRRYGWSQPEGEWGAIQEHTRRDFRAALENGDEPLVDAFLRTMFQGPLCMGLVTFDWRRLPQDNKAFKGGIARALQIWGGEDVRILDAPRVGAPACMDMDGTLIMYDTPRHDHYARRIVSLEPKTVLEIGGGYGGTALQILRRAPDTRIVLVDLPETLYAAWYWLSNAGIKVDWFDGNGDAQVILAPPWEPQLHCTPDVVFAAHSLSEMPSGVCADYMALITDLWRPRYFYHDGASQLPPSDGREPATADLYPETMNVVPAGYRLVTTDKLDWPGTGNRYTEYLYERE